MSGRRVPPFGAEFVLASEYYVYPLTDTTH